MRVERFLGREPALEIIQQAIALYRKTFRAAERNRLCKTSALRSITDEDAGSFSFSSRTRHFSRTKDDDKRF